MKEKLMTLEEAITHCLTNIVDDSICSKNHQQLAYWLVELLGRRKRDEDDYTGVIKRGYELIWK